MIMCTTHDHIYIVDDDSKYLKSLKRLLTSAGYGVEIFSSAQIFLDSVPVSYTTGTLILDLRMPVMDGLVLQQKINKMWSQLQIIIITADAQPGDREHAIKNGAIGFLQKPFQEESLFELVRRGLDKDFGTDTTSAEKVRLEK
jgi:two-component system response regulator FixJ